MDDSQELTGICRLLSERVVELEGENKRLDWICGEAMRQYNAQQKRACDAEAENKRLREALGEAQMQERARCLNIISGYMLNSRAKPYGAVGQALKFIMREMKGANDA